jgi:hypothetical protein
MACFTWFNRHFGAPGAYGASASWGPLSPGLVSWVNAPKSHAARANAPKSLAFGRSASQGSASGVRAPGGVHGGGIAGKHAE